MFFFCENCNGCGGKGSFQEVIQQVGSVIQVSGPQTCMKCSGKGWMHESSMKHDKGHLKCFFCSNCTACNGLGSITPMQPTIIQPVMQPTYIQPVMQPTYIQPVIQPTIIPIGQPIIQPTIVIGAPHHHHNQPHNHQHGHNHPGHNHAHGHNHGHAHHHHHGHK